MLHADLERDLHGRLCRSRAERPPWGFSKTPRLFAHGSGSSVSTCSIPSSPPAGELPGPLRSVPGRSGTPPRGGQVARTVDFAQHVPPRVVAGSHGAVAGLASC